MARFTLGRSAQVFSLVLALSSVAPSVAFAQDKPADKPEKTAPAPAVAALCPLGAPRMATRPRSLRARS